MSDTNKSVNANRVKSITDKFEHLNDQSSGDDSSSRRAAPETRGRLRGSRLSENGADDIDCGISTDVVDRSKDRLDSSYNFGNRKRLREVGDAGLPSEINDDSLNLVRRSSLNFENVTNLLSRQLSDPGKKLQRTPAFRCDRTDKIKDAKKTLNMENNIFKVNERSKQSKEKLKRLGLLVEERIKQDVAEFPFCVEIENKKDSDNVPQHVLAQYAQVVKPKIKNVTKKGLNKSDVVFSDSGVSSESENIISDDLDENDSTKNNFKSIRDCFEDKSKKELSTNSSIDDSLTDTLKKVLKQPLPSGPAPKKPPRTFAASESSPTKSNINDKCLISKSNKSPKSHRTKEESKLMLKKLENALFKHESSGKVLSPRPRKKVESSIESSTAKNQNEIHYMCTELFDLNFSDKENILNSSETSLASLDAKNSFTKCLNSLNCASGSKQSTVKYSKFGSPPNSNAPSLSNVCCSCSLTREKDSQNSSQNIRLSTFRSSDNSLDLSGDPCKKCSTNDKLADASFKCHVDCTCPPPASNSTFFVETGSPSPSQSQYGSVKKSNSESEHIYAEPYDHIKLGNSDPPVLARTQTQLEDDFGNVREANPERFSPDDYFLKDSMARMRAQRFRNSSESPPSNASIKKYPFLRSRTRLEDDFGKIGDGKSENETNSGNKVKDILSRLEGNRGSLKLNKSTLYSKDIPKSDLCNTPDKRGLHYMSSKIYDVPYNDDNKAAAAAAASSGSSTNNSFLYRHQTEDDKKPMSYPRRSSCDGVYTSASASKRPSYLPLNKNTRKLVNNRRGTQSPTSADREKLTHLMSEIYDTVAEVCVLDSSPTTSCKLQHTDMTEASLKLTRTLTEKRKRYVRSMSITRPASIQEAMTLVTLHDTDQPDYVALRNPTAATPAHTEDRLYYSCILVGMNFTTGGAFVKSKYPKNATIPSQIESLVFPEAVDLLDQDNQVHLRRATVKFKKLKCDAAAADVQNYSFVLTDDKGVRNYAYCRRVLPEGYTHTLPLAYCIIAKYRAPAFYNKVLQQIESHHGSLEAVMDDVLSQLYNSSFPKCGQSISVTYLPDRPRDTFRKNNYRKSVNLGDVFNNNAASNSGHLSLQTKDTSLMRSFEKIYGHDLKEFQKVLEEKSNERTLKQTVDNNNHDEDQNTRNRNQISIKRPLEPRVDENNLSILYDSISVQVLVNIFGTLLLERKVIIIGDKLSQLSACVEALQSILYPFVWQHTIISMIPAQLCRDLLEAPVPLLAGLLINGPFHKECPLVIAEIENIRFEEGMLVDISGSCDGVPAEKVLKHQGDESTLLPPIMMKTLITSLQLGTTISVSNGSDDDDDDSRKARNVLVAEAFLRFFIDIMMEYRQYFKLDPYGLNNTENTKGPSVSFERESFLKSHSSKHKQLFLEWFMETTMFKHFIEEQTRLHLHHNDNSVHPHPHPHPHPDFYQAFEERIFVKYAKHLKKNTKNSLLSKNNYKSVLNKKVKLWRDKLKDFIH